MYFNETQGRKFSYAGQRINFTAVEAASGCDESPVMGVAGTGTLTSLESFKPVQTRREALRRAHRLIKQVEAAQPNPSQAYLTAPTSEGGKTYRFTETFDDGQGHPELRQEVTVDATGRILSYFERYSRGNEGSAVPVYARSRAVAMTH